MPAVTTREQAAAALYTLVSVAVGNVVNLITSSRRLREFSAVGPNEMPALFQVQRPEQDERQSGIVGIPNKRTMRFEFFLYTADAQEPSVIPSTQLNAMVDAIENALAPFPVTGIQSLGGLVKSARIEGVVEFYEGLGDGKSVAIVPVAVLIP